MYIRACTITVRAVGTAFSPLGLPSAVFFCVKCSNRGGNSPSLLSSSSSLYVDLGESGIE